MFNFILPFMFTASTATTNYDAIVQRLQKLSQDNPQTTQLIEVGKSDQGLTIYGLKIGNGSVAHLVVGTHHGNEYGSTAVAMGMAESLSAQPIADQTIYVVPVLNISGYNSRSRNERGQGGLSQDANRDYEGPCGTDGPFKLKSTRALADFVASKNIVAAATLHTYMPGVLYPWGLSTRDTRTDDESDFIDLARQATKESGYEVGNSTDALYAADGTFEDYVYWKHGVWSLLFELGRSHSPSENEMNEMVRVNVPGIRRFFESAPKQTSQRHQFTGRCDHNVRQRTKLE